MRIGGMRHRIELQSATSVSDNMGGTTDTWATVATVYASVWPVTVNEQIRAASPTMVATHQVRIRYYEPIRASWRVKFGTRYFSIVSIVDKEERHIQMDLLCREVVR